VGGPNWSSKQVNVEGKEPKQTKTRVLTTANLNCHERFTGLSDKDPTEVPRQIDLRSRKPAIYQFTSDPEAWDLASEADEAVDFFPWIWPREIGFPSPTTATTRAGFTAMQSTFFMMVIMSKNQRLTQEPFSYIQALN